MIEKLTVEDIQQIK